MNNFVLVYPMCAMVVLTCCVLGALFRARVKSVSSGQIEARYFKTYRGEDEPDSLVQLSRHYINIFEAPTLFYVACLVAMITEQSTALLISLAWLYVGLRVIHAYIHIGSNKLRPRIRVYLGSWIVLATMWGALTVGVFMGGAVAP